MNATIESPTISGTPRRDSLGTASLALGVAGLLPLPGVVASVMAIALGLAAGVPDEHGRTRRSQSATAGIALGAASLVLFTVICTLVFVVLDYPMPHIATYHEPAACSCG